MPCSGSERRRMTGPGGGQECKVFSALQPPRCRSLHSVEQPPKRVQQMWCLPCCYAIPYVERGQGVELAGRQKQHA